MRLAGPEEKASPLVAGRGIARWTAVTTGVAGGAAYEFRARKGSEETVEQKGPSPTWDWTPPRAGTYSVRVSVRDPLGHTAESGWSPEVPVVPPLAVAWLGPDKPAPRAARTAIRWTVSATGGIAPLSYEFRILSEGKEEPFPKGPSPVLEWKPAAAGKYRVKAVVTDARGNAADSGWSQGYEISAPLSLESLRPDRTGPQAAGTPIRWTVSVSGGVGGRTFEFRTVRRGADTVDTLEQMGPSPEWVWTPSTADVYRVKVFVRDESGAVVAAEWPRDYPVVPPPVMAALRPDTPPPQAAESAPIRWTAAAKGGVGPLRYRFLTEKAGKERVEQEETSPVWEWRPVEPGVYRVKVVAIDGLCNMADGGWSPEYEIAPALRLTPPAPSMPAPQAAGTVAIRWSVSASGGIGPRTYAFHLVKGTGDAVVQIGPSPEWEWTPSEAGRYVIRVTVQDARGNTADSGRSPEYEIAPPLSLASLSPDRPSPQAAMTGTIRWTVRAAGGVGERTYEFWRTDGEKETGEQKGLSNTWAWNPEESGKYRVRVVVRDALGNRADGGWSGVYEVTPPLRIASLRADKSPPQAAGTTPVRWTATATGGVGERSYEFRVSGPGGERAAQTGPSPAWDWTPEAPGRYRVKVIVRDIRGNAADSGWSRDFEMTAPPVVLSLLPDREAPQRAVSATILWKASAAGGIGALSYEFRTKKGAEETVRQKGPSAAWVWQPQEPGAYAVKVIIRDSLGNASDSGWSPEYGIEKELGTDSLIAVFPMENLSGAAAPMRRIRKDFTERLRATGLRILPEEEFERFMERHRVRYTGGLSRELGSTLRRETGTSAVLVSSLDLYAEPDPPKIACTARLVSTGPTPAIRWMDSVDMAGNDSPGILGIGLVHSPGILRDRAVRRITESLSGYLSGRSGQGKGTEVSRSGRFLPRGYFLSRRFQEVPGRTLRVSVLPFYNDSTRKHAGEIVRLHFLRWLAAEENLVVIDPGEVRIAILTSRTIMPGGVSLPQADLLREMLETDLLFSGSVKDYQDATGPTGTPVVNFSGLAVDAHERKLVWSSISYNRGNDGVFFFDWGRLHTAHALASEMCRKVIGNLFRTPGKQETLPGGPTTLSGR